MMQKENNPTWRKLCGRFVILVGLTLFTVFAIVSHPESSRAGSAECVTCDEGYSGCFNNCDPSDNFCVGECGYTYGGCLHSCLEGGSWPVSGEQRCRRQQSMFFDYCMAGNYSVCLSGDEVDANCCENESSELFNGCLYP